jgi:membrane-associated phospholipid phosphatase
MQFRENRAGLETRASSALLFLFEVYPVQDLVLISYLGTVLALVIRRPAASNPAHCAHLIYGALAAILLGAFASRAPLIRWPVARAALYRIAILGVLLGNYLMLRDVLPVVRPDSVDANLYDLDLRIFGVEPALWLERFNTHATVEWFAFFYFSYFSIAIVYMIAVIWLRAPDRATTELAIGTTLVFSLGQLGYMAVPGVGPGQFLAAEFHGPLHGGFFWGCVGRVVSAGSAMKDIFPSLHTAVPTLLTWFAVRRARTNRRWRLPALATGFFAANIIVSTMLLRWHYAVDVVAGLALGCGVGWLSPRIAAREARERRRAGMRHPWNFADN